VEVAFVLRNTTVTVTTTNNTITISTTPYGLGLITAACHPFSYTLVMPQREKIGLS